MAAALTAVLYGTSFVATGVALRAFGPLAVAGLRGALSWVLLVVLVLLPFGLSLPRRDLGEAGWSRLLVLGVLGGPLFLATMSTAVALSGATITSFVAGSYAVLTAVLAVPVLREPLTMRTVSSLIMALAGTALLAELQATSEALSGIAWGLTAAFSFAAFLVLSRRWSSRYGLTSPTVALVTQGLTPLAVVALVPLTGQALTHGPLDPWALAAVGWLAVGPGAVAAVLVVTSIRRLSAAQASALLLLNPPVAAAGGVLLLGERLSLLQIVGGALILLAIGSATGAWRLLAPVRSRA